MILKANNQELEINILFSKARKFQNEFCKDDETLLTKVPESMVKKDGIDTLMDVWHVFQTSETKMSKDDIGKFLDFYFSENEKDMYDLYTEVLKEFDVSGIFKRGMGFKMATTMMNKMEEVIEKEALGAAKKVCEVVPAALGDSIGDIAALSVAAEVAENAGETAAAEEMASMLPKKETVHHAIRNRIGN